MSVSKEVYLNRKENHLCTKCGGIAELNKTLCLHHLQIANKNQNAMYARRKIGKQCRLCGQKLCNNRKICNICLEKQVSKSRDDIWIPHKDRIKHGLCSDCGKQNSTKNLHCYVCSKKRIRSQSLTRQQKIAKGLCGVCGKGLLAKDKKRCVICIHDRKKWWSTSKTRLRKIEQGQLFKDQIIQHYGGKCNCCGETEQTFLAIDHINGNGNSHRKKIKKSSSSSFYKWLIDKNFPDEFQILCYNCNMSKYLRGGICAHKKSSIA